MKIITYILFLSSFNSFGLSSVLTNDCSTLAVHIGQLSANTLAYKYSKLLTDNELQENDDLRLYLNLNKKLETTSSSIENNIEEESDLRKLDLEYGKIFKSIIHQYSHICSLESFLQLDLGSLLYQVEFEEKRTKYLWRIATMSFKPNSPLEDFKVHREVLEKKTRYDYCVRDPQIIDKITIHHTDTAASLGAQDVNEIHLRAGFAIVGYHYILRSNYKSDPHLIRAKAFYGRSFDWVGGHNKAKLNSYNPLYVDKDEVKFSDILDNSRDWDEASRYIFCYSKSLEEEKEISVKKYFSARKYMTENIRSLGIGISGRYYDGHEMNAESVNALAKLICAIKKEHQGVKYIDTHQDTRRTRCPGHIRFQLDSIKRKVKENCPNEEMEFIYL